jgi:hypothetical protein
VTAVLADTSAWVEYLRGTGSPPHRRLRRLVAVVAIRAGAEPLHRDQDFEVIARHAPLRVAG